jgi:hypothetical protein
MIYHYFIISSYKNYLVSGILQLSKKEIRGYQLGFPRTPTAFLNGLVARIRRFPPDAQGKHKPLAIATRLNHKRRFKLARAFNNNNKAYAFLCQSLYIRFSYFCKSKQYNEKTLLHTLLTFEFLFFKCDFK